MSSPAPLSHVICYVDGFNLYHGMMEHSKCRGCKWLDLNALAASILLPGHTLDGVKFFTSVPPWDHRKARRHRTYLDALKSVGVEVVEGRFQHDTRRCRATCGELFPDPVEKLTDVHIATSILADAVADRFDWAYLISGDADQAPTIRTVHEIAPAKKVHVIFPPRRSAAELTQVADRCFGEIGSKKLKKCQLPPTITLPGRIIQKPDSW